MPGIKPVQAIKDWDPRKRILIWVDNEHSWVIKMVHHRALLWLPRTIRDCEVDPHTFEKCIYLSAGQKQIPGWGEMSVESARTLHKDMRNRIKE